MNKSYYFIEVDIPYWFLIVLVIGVFGIPVINIYNKSKKKSEEASIKDTLVQVKNDIEKLNIKVSTIENIFSKKN